MMIKTVLTIEDSEPDQFLTKRAILDFDNEIEVLQAYDGKEALAILKERNAGIDLIFLDINMPGMNGFEFLETYTAQEDETKQVVIMLTSSSQEKDIERAKGYSFVKEYLVKPLTHDVMAELKEKL